MRFSRPAFILDESTMKAFMKNYETVNLWPLNIWQWGEVDSNSDKKLYGQKSVRVNYDLLSHFFDKNFVKATVFLKKLLKSWFDGIFLVRERISHFSSVWYANFYAKKNCKFEYIRLISRKYCNECGKTFEWPLLSR